MIDRRKYQMKNEVLIKLRELFQMCADPLPDCTELPNEDDIYSCLKKCITLENQLEVTTIRYLFTRIIFGNVVAKGYPLNLVTKTLRRKY